MSAGVTDTEKDRPIAEYVEPMHAEVPEKDVDMETDGNIDLNTCLYICICI